MSATKGTVAKIVVKESTVDQFGNNMLKSFKLDGDEKWYGLGKSKGDFINIKKGKDFLKLKEGDVIEFMYDESEYNGKTYYNTKSSNIKLVASGSGSLPSSQSVSPKAQATSNTTTFKSGGYEAGIKVGHAINNAVQIAIHNGDTSNEAIRQLAVQILRLSKEIESSYSEIVGGVSGEEESKEQVQQEVVEPKKVAPKPVQKGSVAKATAPASVVDFDDEIPF